MINYSKRVPLISRLVVVNSRNSAPPGPFANGTWGMGLALPTRHLPQTPSVNRGGQHPFYPHSHLNS